ncbi:MAG: hypothetical protein FJX74_04350 [Armatimonadetes bacterium]|nr:hypothetical protein [Armatimonadota bacterium]
MPESRLDSQSPAYLIWEEYLADAEALERVRACGGVWSQGASRPLDEEETWAVERAIVVAISAAFERYVVELFTVVARRRGWKPSRIKRHLAQFGSISLHGDILAFLEEEGVAPETRSKLSDLRWPSLRFANPSSPNVSRLFSPVLGGKDVWSGVTAAGQLSEEQVKELVDSHLEDRHDIAHGRERRRPLRAGPIDDTISAFREFVPSLDECANG